MNPKTMLIIKKNVFVTAPIFMYKLFWNELDKFYYYLFLYWFTTATDNVVYYFCVLYKCTNFITKKIFDIYVWDRAHLKKSFKQVIEEIIMFNYMYIYKFVNVVYYLFVSIVF